LYAIMTSVMLKMRWMLWMAECTMVATSECRWLSTADLATIAGTATAVVAVSVGAVAAAVGPAAVLATAGGPAASLAADRHADDPGLVPATARITERGLAPSRSLENARLLSVISLGPGLAERGGLETAPAASPTEDRSHAAGPKMTRSV